MVRRYDMVDSRMTFGYLDVLANAQVLVPLVPNTSKTTYAPLLFNNSTASLCP